MSIFQNPSEKIERLHALWNEKPWTRPSPCGLMPSMGYGDRLGLATPGHIQTHKLAGLDGKVAAILSQQSAREMERLSRSPVDVMLDAASAVANDRLACWGADADHLKTEEQVAGCVEAGFTFFTADPSDEVGEDPSALSDTETVEKFQALNAATQDAFGHYIESYANAAAVEGYDFLSPTPDKVMRIALAYGKAIRRLHDIYCWVSNNWKQDEPFDFEVSVDETAFATEPLAHLVVARELKRLGMRFTSLAPRFNGEFQKAIDYIGDMDEFRANLRQHQAIALSEGPYKLSVHSGSDKFSIYPLLAEETGGILHLKTSGTSYLEGLRVAALSNPALFRSIIHLCREVFEEQRKSYHIKATLSELPDPDKVPDQALSSTYLDFGAADSPRQIIHVCFGAVLKPGGSMSKEIRETIQRNQAQYAECLKSHLGRHLVVFGR